MKKINDTESAFVIKIQALYDIERQLEKALPKLAKASTDPVLKKGFLSHLEETKEHSMRLEKIFSLLEEKPKKVTCEGIKGIIKDGDWVAKLDAPSALKDSMLASAARYAEHYEMAGYMGAIEEAQNLGLDDAVELLEMTLEEEVAADEKLAEACTENLERVEEESEEEE